MPAADRLARLAASIRRTDGEWTTARVMRWYREAGIAPPHATGPGRATARRDLKALTKRGVLLMHDNPARRYFTPTTTDPKGAAQ